MIYMFKVYALVAVPVFGLAGVLILTLLAWKQAKEYAAARQIMRRITPRVFRESLVNSRMSSRIHHRDSFRPA
jgi:hypothetical protein